MGSVSWLGDAPSSWANQHELRDVGSPSPWHGSPLQGIVIVCSATRISSDSKEQVCTPDGARGDAQNLLGVWEPGRGETKGWGLEWTEPGMLDGRQQCLGCRNQIAEVADGLVSCWTPPTPPGLPCLGGQPHPTLGLLWTDAAKMSANVIGAPTQSEFHCSSFQGALASYMIGKRNQIRR